MENISRIFSDFIGKLKNEILEYFNLTNSYLKDLVAYKNIDLKMNISEKEEIKKTLEKILKAVKTGLNTIGIPITILNKTQEEFMEIVSNQSSNLPNYDSYVDLYQKTFTNKILFEILIDYLLDLDKKKIENLKLFDLVSQNFLNKLNEFREQNIRSTQTKVLLAGQDFNDFIDFSTLNFTKVPFKTIEKAVNQVIVDPKEDLKKLEREKEPEKDILKQLQEAKKDIIETLKLPKTDLITPSLIEMEKRSAIKYKKYFLDLIGNLSPVHPEILNEFKIDIVSLLNSRVKNIDLLDLENLFYFISSLKLLNIDFPFSTMEILEIMKNYINESIFSTSKENIPDIKNIYYGLSILSELNLIRKTDIVDFDKIENIIKANLKNSVPEMLESNYYSLLSLKLIKDEFLEISDIKGLVSQIGKLDLSNLEEFRPIEDIYNHLSLINVLELKINSANLKTGYLSEIKKLISSDGSINNLFTDSAKTLLILELLDLKEQEPDLCSNLLNFIINSTIFFNLTNLNEDFNWRNNQMGYKIELKMLFWALFASSRYAPKQC